MSGWNFNPVKSTTPRVVFDHFDRDWVVQTLDHADRSFTLETDPLGVAHGVAVAGNTGVWLIIGGRLFLFYDHDRLKTFTADPERITGAATRKWPDLLHTLSP